MRIGSGGLQAVITNDAVKQPRPPDNVQRLANEPPGETGLSSSAPSRQEVIRAVDKLNYAAELYNRPLEFRLKEKDKKMKVQVREKGYGNYGSQLREIPPEKAIEMAETLSKRFGGLYDEEV
ncbi:MAG: FlaG protein [Pelotomaculum sp. PtaB.Bin104]|nr:MAG: FlaG protein [Pelotomaculum sp. PtaB.Bin104]